MSDEQRTELLENIIKDVLNKGEIQSELGYNNSQIARSIVKALVINGELLNIPKEYTEFNYGDII